MLPCVVPTARPATRGPVQKAACMTSALVVLHSLISAIVILFVLLHSGKDAGLSGALGVGAGGGAHGGSSAIVERNLDRLTVLATVAFFVTSYLLARTL